MPPLLNIDFSEIIFRLKIVSFIFSSILFVLAWYFIVQFQKLLGFRMEQAKAFINPPEQAFGGASQSKWEEAVHHIESEHESDWKLAIIEADKLVDSLLKSGGFYGETMGERLTNMEKGQLINLEGLWEAHKIRNKLVHDINYFLRYGEAKRAMLHYEAVLKELGAI